MKAIKGLLALIEEQKLILENAKQMHIIIKIIKESNRVMKEASKGLSVSDLEALKEEMENSKSGQHELNDFFNENSEEKGNKIEKKEEEKKEEKKEEKQNIEDNEKIFKQYKEEGIGALKKDILSIIFANEGISLEGLKRMQDQLDYIKKTQKEFNNFFKNYTEDYEEKED